MPRKNEPFTGGTLKGPSLKGVAYVYPRKGQLVVAKWPRSRGGGEPANKERRDNFGTANRLWRYTDEWIQTTLIEATAGTPYYPRDWFITSLYGRFAALHDPEIGVTAYPMASKLDVSNSLDTIAQMTGDIVVRYSDAWGALHPGPAGTVLTSNGDSLAPSYKPSGVTPGGRFSGFFPGGGTSTPTSNRATRATMFQAEAPSLVEGMAIWINDGTNDARYQGRIVKIEEPVSPPVITEVLGVTAEIETLDANPRQYTALFPSLVTLEEGAWYVAAAARVDAAPTTDGRIVNSTLGAILGPVFTGPYAFHYASTGIAPGDEPLETFTNLTYATGLV